MKAPVDLLAEILIDHGDALDTLPVQLLDHFFGFIAITCPDMENIRIELVCSASPPLYGATSAIFASTSTPLSGATCADQDLRGKNIAP